jgi:hypothetical protein
MKVDRVLAGNEDRCPAWASEGEDYDPVAGLGSPLERTPVEIEPGRIWNIPERMAGTRAAELVLEAGSLEAFAKERDMEVEDVAESFARLRLQYDYEYWCACCVTIKNKDGDLQPLTLNPPQRKSLAARERQRLAGAPIRQIELKHRQYGSTTEKNAYVAWHQLVRRRGFDAYVLSLQQGQAARIVARYNRLVEHYPLPVAENTRAALTPYQGLQNTKAVEGRDCFLAIGSAKNPNAPSGETIQGALISEVGKMGDTAHQGATKLITNVTSMVPQRPGTLLLIESTAEESGTWFKEEVEKARQGQGGYEFTFVSWMEDPSCTYPLDGIDTRAFVRSWDDYEETLWERGATLQQIHWWRREERQKPSRYKMLQENPTTPSEAFQHDARRVLPPHYVQTARRVQQEPSKRGRLVSNAQTGSEAFREITFEEDPSGSLVIWREPGDTYNGLLEEGACYRRRYVAASDVGPGQSEGADYHDTIVLDRAPVLFGGMPEIVCEWHGHLDVDLYAWAAARLAYWYGKAFWAIEVNSLAKKTAEVPSPDFGLTVMDEIKGAYPNLYQREVFDSVKQELTKKAGWHTNKNTKGIMVSALTKALRGFYEQTEEEGESEHGYVERSSQALNEMDSFLHVDGRMEAAPKKHDDRVDTRGIALHLHQDQPPPVKVEPQERRERPKSMATF